MAEHPQNMEARQDRLDLGPRAWGIFAGAGAAGCVGLLLAIVLGYAQDDNFRRFSFSYLTAFAYFLSIALGCLLFVVLQHLVSAGWSVSVRRVGEAMACTLPILAALSAPIVMSAVLQNGTLYPWARPASAYEQIDAHHGGSAEHKTPATAPAAGAPHAAINGPSHGGETITLADVYHDPDHKGLDALTKSKRPFLNVPFFLARVAIYLAIWAGIGFWYWRQSTLQDETGDLRHSVKMKSRAAPAILLVFLALTFGSVDLLMTLDPHWFSTMFGVYYFSGSAVGAFATMIVVIVLLQRGGFLTHSISTEHYHDLGKFLFAFVFFWGYIAFSQYMLLWYANIPEETSWLVRRGATTVKHLQTGWTIVCLVLLFGHLLLPFAGLLSRNAKRNRAVLTFWAVWMLVMHYLDIYWLVMPEYSSPAQRVRFGLIDIAALVGVGGVVVAAFVRILARHPLRPARDPRLDEALAFQNL